MKSEFEPRLPDPFYIRQYSGGYEILISESDNSAMLVFDGLDQEKAVEFRYRLNKAVARNLGLGGA